jgi:hypothetical protein
MYSFFVLTISVLLAASAYAQPLKNKDKQHWETRDVSNTISMDSTTDFGEDPATTDHTEDPAATDPGEDPAAMDPIEDPAAPPPSDSVFASMSDDACPGVLDPVVVERFRVIAPTLVQRCEDLRDAPLLTSPTTTSDQSTLPSDQGTVPAEENTIDSTQL